MKIAICDGLSEERAAIAKRLCTYFSEPTLSEFEDGDALVCAHEKTRFDLILLDMLMPGLNDIQTAKKIREYDAQTPIIFATTTEDFAVQSYRVLAFDYLRKPVKAEAIVQCLSCFTKMLPDKRFVSALIRISRTFLSSAKTAYFDYVFGKSGGVQ